MRFVFAVILLLCGCAESPTETPVKAVRAVASSVSEPKAGPHFEITRDEFERRFPGIQFTGDRENRDAEINGVQISTYTENDRINWAMVSAKPKSIAEIGPLVDAVNKTAAALRLPKNEADGVKEWSTIAVASAFEGYRPFETRLSQFSHESRLQSRFPSMTASAKRDDFSFVVLFEAEVK